MHEVIGSSFIVIMNSFSFLKTEDYCQLHQDVQSHFNVLKHAAIHRTSNAQREETLAMNHLFCCKRMLYENIYLLIVVSNKTL